MIIWIEGTGTVENSPNNPVYTTYYIQDEETGTDVIVANGVGYGDETEVFTLPNGNNPDTP